MGTLLEKIKLLIICRQAHLKTTYPLNLKACIQVSTDLMDKTVKIVKINLKDF